MGLFKRQRNMNNYYMPEDRHPICPHCKKQIDGLMSRKVDSSFGTAYVWACPECLNVLGVGHRSGFVLN